MAVALKALLLVPRVLVRINFFIVRAGVLLDCGSRNGVLLRVRLVCIDRQSLLVVLVCGSGFLVGLAC